MDAVPGLGEHVDAILQELGKTPAQIEALRAVGAV
jgi:crotonobetainyl-CoA:carnitine CoA-transferase CaiB-like acyl-CoA transferase